MSLNCFFGIEVKPDGIPVIPIIPPHSSLVITQCAVTSVCAPAKHLSSATTETNCVNNNNNDNNNNNHKSGANDNDKPKKAVWGGPVTLYVQSHEIPTRFAVCTLDPSHGVTFCPLQLIFSKHAALTLLTESAHKSNVIDKTKDKDVKGKKNNTQTNNAMTDGKGNSNVSQSSVEESTWYPTVHLTGYYEAEEEEEEEEEEEDDEEDEEKMYGSSDEEEEQEFYGRGGHNLHHYHQEVYEDDDDDVHDEVQNQKWAKKSNKKRRRELASHKDHEIQRNEHKTKQSTKPFKVQTDDKHAAKKQKESKRSKRTRETLLKAEQ